MSQPSEDSERDRDQALNNNLFETMLLEISEDLLRHIDQRIPLWLRNACSSEDVLQETLIKAYQKIDGFHGFSKNSFYVWMKTIADNQLRDVIRHSTRNKRGGQAKRAQSRISFSEQFALEFVELLSNDGDTPSQRLMASEARQALQIGIASLSNEQRTAIHLRYLDGKRIDEVVSEMGTTHGAVRGLLQRARKQLRDSLARSSKWFCR